MAPAAIGTTMGAAGLARVDTIPAIGYACLKHAGHPEAAALYLLIFAMESGLFCADTGNLW
jgi:hypothetical protein